MDTMLLQRLLMFVIQDDASHNLEEFAANLVHDIYVTSNCQIVIVFTSGEKKATIWLREFHGGDPIFYSWSITGCGYKMYAQSRNTQETRKLFNELLEQYA